jgi:single-strand DNA-binding protein
LLTDSAGVEKYSTDIIADSMQMLGGKSEMGASASNSYKERNDAPMNLPSSAPSASLGGAMDDDIPF